MLRAMTQAVRPRHPLTRTAAAIAALVVLGACATTAPPSNQANACAILDERDAWEDHVFEAARRWGVSPGTILAFIRQESSFRRDARPLDRNGRPRSSALGYSQALDGTWAEYVADQGRGSRKDFEDATDFIGWYLDRISRQTGIDKSDPRNLYLAYHEGPGGYRRGTYSAKPWLLEVAGRVDGQAETYDQQLRGCERRQMRRFDRAASL
jgi:hypothetical protein